MGNLVDLEHLLKTLAQGIMITGGIVGFGVGGYLIVDKLKRKKTKKRIENGLPPYSNEGQLYFPEMKDYIDYI